MRITCSTHSAVHCVSVGAWKFNFMLLECLIIVYFDENKCFLLLYVLEYRLFVFLYSTLFTFPKIRLKRGLQIFFQMQNNIIIPTLFVQLFFLFYIPS